MKRAEQKSIEWQIAHHPMAIGGDDFTDLVEYVNINPAYVAGYEQAEKDLALTWEDIAKIDSLILETNNEFAVDYQKEISRRQFYEAVLQKYLHLNNRV